MKYFKFPIVIGRRGSNLLLALTFVGLANIVAGCSGLVSANHTIAKAPAIATPAAKSITTNSVNIQWATNVPATSQVDYGTTSNYGASTPVDSNLVLQHSVVLKTLSAGQIYHFQVLSAANGQQATSTDQTFKTTDSIATISNLSPTSGPVAGGTLVTINGSNFSAGSNVQFAGSTAQGVTVVNNTQIRATTPAHASGVVSVQVVNAAVGGTSAPFNSFTYQDANSPLTVSTSSLQGGTVGASYTDSIQASGGQGPYTWSIAGGQLPAALSLASNGTLSGKPLLAGTATFTVRVADSANNASTKSLNIAIAAATKAALAITGYISTTASNGVSYTSAAQAVNGTQPYTWSLASGQLPPGLNLTNATGTISGTPNVNGQYNFALKVTDSGAQQQSATASYSITVGTSIFDQYGGIATMPSPNPPTGFFRTEKFGNKWMLVDPANNGYFMIAMYVLESSSSIDDMHSSYSARASIKYGDTGPMWATAQLQRIQSWGYTATGPYTSAYALPVTTDARWHTVDQTNPVKVPFVGLVRPALYGMQNQNNWAPQPIKNMLFGVSPYYTGFKPRSGAADYFDSNLTTFFTNELNNDRFTKTIKNSASKQYLIGMNADDSDQMFGFGKGPDFAGGYNSAHLGWVVLTMSPAQTANPNKGFVYSDTVVYSKKALRDQLAAKYGTIDALNGAWGSSYSTFDTSGSIISAEQIATGNGTSQTFSKTLTHAAVSAFSLQISVSGQPVGGDTGAGQIWGPNLSGTINYSTGALNISFSSGHAPANAAAITANYIQNGWGIGSGLMDEDGRPSHRTWTGIDYVFMTDVNATAKTDLDEYLYQIAAHYFSMCKTGINNWLPGVMYLGPDTLGTWGGPSNRNVLKAASQYIDVMAMSGTPALSQSMLDFIYTYYGDKPIYTAEFRTANMDSGFFRYQASVRETDSPTQGARGQSYYNGVTPYATKAYSASGSRPYVGVLWWQYLDNWGEKDDWGLVSLSDNAYDGHESTTASVACSAPLQNFQCGGEERNYGDVISWLKQAHQQIMQSVQH